MTRMIVLALALAIAAPSLATAKSRAHRAYAAQSGPQIACTFNGCVPVPPGCRQVPGKTWSGEPTGMDVILCPRGIRPFR